MSPPPAGRNLSMNCANFGFVSFVRRKELFTALKSVDLPARLGRASHSNPGKAKLPVIETTEGIDPQAAHDHGSSS